MTRSFAMLFLCSSEYECRDILKKSKDKIHLQINLTEFCHLVIVTEFI